MCLFFDWIFLQLNVIYNIGEIWQNIVEISITEVWGGLRYSLGSSRRFAVYFSMFENVYDTVLEVWGGLHYTFRCLRRLTIQSWKFEEVCSTLFDVWGFFRYTLGSLSRFIAFFMGTPQISEIAIEELLKLPKNAQTSTRITKNLLKFLNHIYIWIKQCKLR